MIEKTKEFLINNFKINEEVFKISKQAMEDIQQHEFHTQNVEVIKPLLY